MMRATFMTALLLLAGCSSRTNGDGPAGSWSSSSCPNRKYVRTLDLASDGTFVAQDLVAPCPKGAVCVWSGIVDRKGTWRLAGSKLELTSSAEAHQQGADFPASLTWSGEVLTEEVANGRCDYARR